MSDRLMTIRRYYAQYNLYNLWLGLDVSPVAEKCSSRAIIHLAQIAPVGLALTVLAKAVNVTVDDEVGDPPTDVETF